MHQHMHPTPGHCCRTRKRGGRLVAVCLTVAAWATLTQHATLAQPPGTPARQASNTTLIRLGTTYSRAQTAAWLDKGRFVVGRWDGTITLFRTMASETEFGPVLITALATPSKRGIEMVASLGDGTFVSSNNVESIILWRPTDHGFAPLTLPFDSQYGTAVSAVVTGQPGARWLVVGHQHGFLTIWALDHDGGSAAADSSPPRLLRAVTVRSEHPVSWQWQTWHVRGLAACGSGRVISVAEDGDLCLLEIPSGRVISRQRYNDTAQRGLNDVAVWGDLIAVVNCAVGADDKNLWIYRIAGNSLKLVASEKLILDKTRDPVFTFSVELFEFDGRAHFAVSTEEGLIWLGTLKDHKIVLLDQRQVAVEGGVVLAWDPSNKMMLAAGHQIQTYTFGPRPVPHDTPPKKP